MTEQRRSLTENEREIRSSRGISLWRVLPFIIMFLALCAMAVDNEMFHRCLGIDPQVGYRGKASIVRLGLALPCSPYFLNGSLSNWLIEASFWGAIPFALPQAHFIFRHTKYWNRVRAREKELRKEKRAKKLAGSDSHSNSTMT